LPETGLAVDALGGGRPGVVLFVGEGAPEKPDAAKGFASAELGRAGGFAGHGVATTDLAIAGSDADGGADLTGLRDIEYFHIDCRGGGVPGPVRVSAQAVGDSRSTRADLMP